MIAFPSDDSSRRSDFDSSDCLIFYIDGPGDTTVRPPSPLLRQIGMALREKLTQHKALPDQSPPPETPESPDAS